MMMFSIRDFSAGFVIGFGSGVAFRSLADNDFAPVKDVLKTGIGIAQKAGDAVMEGFGRLRESIEDVRAMARSENVHEVRHRAKPRARSIPRERQRRKATAKKAVRYHA